MSEPISSTCLCSEPYQVPSLRPLIAQLNIFIHTHKIHTVGVYPRLNRTCDIACTLIIGVYPNVWLINLPPRIIVSRRTPPVAFLLIFTYLYHSTPRIVPSVEHIRKRCVFIRCSQRRRTSILCLRCRYLFLANPLGGGKTYCFSYSIIFGSTPL